MVDWFNADYFARIGNYLEFPLVSPMCLSSGDKVFFVTSIINGF